MLETLLDRFMIRVRSGYNDPEEEFHILRVADKAESLQDVKPVTTTDELIKLIEIIKKNVVVGDRVAKYIIDLVSYLRRHEAVEYGPSHRGSVYLYRIARSYAVLQGRDYVIPDDIKRFAVEVLAHRIRLRREKEFEGVTADDLVREALSVVKVPKE